MNRLKLRAARIAQRTGLNRLLLGFQAAFQSPYIRALNYHDVSAQYSNAFEGQLRFFREHFTPVGLAELECFFNGDWQPDRPGLILSFDDGLRSHVDIAAPLLEQYGFCGWFCIPVGLPDAVLDDHESFQERHSLQYDSRGYGDGRGAMSWEEVQRLSEHHVIVCHSYHHTRLSAELSTAELELEIVEAKRLMEERLGFSPTVFAWVGGEESSYSELAAKVIRDAGFDYSFMTNSAPIRPSTHRHQLQRTNVEAQDPPEIVGLSLSGLLDIFYWPKRRRVNRLTHLDG